MTKILIVDDIESNRKVLRKMLAIINDSGIVEALNGREAVTLFESESPDLILMDIDMPVMNGFQAASEIKAMQGDNHVPIIFVTALGAETSLGYALASGGDDFISKPVNVEVLESKINAHLRIRELNQQLNENNKTLVLHNQKLKYEHELIEHFFESALRKSFLDKDIIRYHMSSMSTFNGDLFLVERGPRGGLYILMGDFTGHGLTAAMGTLPVAMIFFKMAAKCMSVSDMACELNQQLYDLMPTGMFFAASLIEINARCDMMSVWMGGVPESYFLASNGDLKSVIQSQHMPLGILKDTEFNSQAEIYTIEKGDKIYLYSDGVIEAQDSTEKMFGNERLKDILVSADTDRFTKVLDALGDFTGGANQNDDVTLVEVSCCEVAALDDEASILGMDKPCFPWQMSMQLSVSDMREDDPITRLSEMLGSLAMLAKHKGVIHVLLSEMYANALEHGILGLQSNIKQDDDSFVEYYNERQKRLSELSKASIGFEINYATDTRGHFLDIKMSHSGDGNNKASVVNEAELHGRGMLIVNSICESVLSTNNGKTISIVYRL